jgi:Protein of unknown function (DUF3309)
MVSAVGFTANIRYVAQGRRWMSGFRRNQLAASRLSSTSTSGGYNMSLGTILLIVIVIALLGGFSGIGGGPFYGTGYYGGGGLGIILVIVLILVLMGRL